MSTAQEWDGVGESPWLYSKTASGAVNVWQCWAQGANVEVRWGQEGGALQYASYECHPKNAGRSNSTTAEEQAVKEAVAKFKKQLKKKYFTTREEALNELNLKPMLAKDFEDRRGTIKYDVDVQPKLDGVRCLAYKKDGKTVLQSRGGDPYDIPHVAAELEDADLPEGIVLDGELYVHGVSLQALNSWVRRLQPLTYTVGYYVYDTFTLWDKDGVMQPRLEPWEVRKVNLCAWFEDNKNGAHFVRQVPTTKAVCEEVVRQTHDYYVRLGYEGAIIRLLHGTYRLGYRSSELLKLKSFQDAEFLIISYTVGKGKFANVPIFRCVTGEGKEFDVAPKGTDVQRAEMLAKADSLVGKQMTVRFFDWTDDRVPHFPVGIGIREEGS